MRRVCTLLFPLVACAGGPTPRPSDAGRDGERPTARIVVLADLDGTLEPCGCRSRPLGGADRVAARVRALSSEGVPTVLFVVGDTFFGEPVLAPERAPQERIEARTLARILGELGADAVAPGRADLADGLDGLRGAIEGCGLALLASNLSPRDVFEDARVIEAGTLRIGVFGITQSSHRGDAPPVAGVVIGEPFGPARRAIRRLRAEGVDLVVALGAMGRRGSRGLAHRAPGIDLVLVGDADTYPPPETEHREGALVIAAGHQGQALTLVDLFPHGDGRSWVDGTRGPAIARRIRRIDRRIADLEVRLGRARGATRRDLEARIVELRADRRRAARGRAPEGESYVKIRSVEIGPEVRPDPEAQALVEEAVRRVAEENGRAFADERPPPVPEGTAGYSGGATCARCHERADRFWRTTPHSRAFQTLEATHRHRHLDCVGCHLTGFRKPGGSTVMHNEALRGVQCEACHGPSSLHVAAEGRERPFAVTREVPEARCVGCHTAERSDRFDHGSYRDRILGSGHGIPVQEN